MHSVWVIWGMAHQLVATPPPSSGRTGGNDNALFGLVLLGLWVTVVSIKLTLWLRAKLRELPYGVLDTERASGQSAPVNPDLPPSS